MFCFAEILLYIIVYG